MREQLSFENLVGNVEHVHDLTSRRTKRQVFLSGPPIAFWKLMNTMKDGNFK